MRIPKELRDLDRKTKNITKNAFGEKTGRVWVDTQDMSKMQTRKMKGLKRKTSRDGEDAAVEAEGSGDDEE